MYNYFDRKNVAMPIQYNIQLVSLEDSFVENYLPGKNIFFPVSGRVAVLPTELWSVPVYVD